MSLSLLSLGTLAALSGTSALAQTGVLHVGDWSMVPIVQTSTGQIKGILAVKDSAATSGSNLSVAAYRKSATGVWSAATWTDGVSAASAWLGANGESVALAEIEGIVIAEVSGSGLTQGGGGGPTTLVGGVEEGDEFEDLVADPIVGPSILSLLVASGYPAADVPVSGDTPVDPCEENAVLNAALAGFTATPSQSAATYSSSLLVACVDWCFPWSWTTTPTAWSAWSCGPWSFKSGPLYRSSCIDQCTYERTVSRTRTKDTWSLALDCSYTLVTYRQTESGTQTGTCDLDLTSVSCVSGALACPATPACDLSWTLCSAGPMSGTTRSGWEVVP